MASRAPAPAALGSAEAVAAPTPSRHRETLRVRTALKISSPGDGAEREAETTARRVVSMPAPVGPIARRTPLMPARAPAVPVPRPQAPPAAAAAPPRARPPDETSPELEDAIKKELGGGGPLPPDVQSFMAPRFKADFGGVRVHTGPRAENLATRLGAKAFTYGRDIFFNAGQFQPDGTEGMELIAHELTHTIQQRQVVQREVAAEAAPVDVQETSAPKVQRGIVSRALDWIADKANYIPGFRLFTIVIGLNPINMSRVDRSGANILRALIEFIPGGGLIVEALENHGIFEKGGKFIEDQFRSLGMVGSAFRDALMEFIDSLGWRDIFRLGSVWSRAKRIFTDPVDKLIDFGKGLVIGIAEIVKAAILRPLGRFAASVVPKWDLLIGVFGKNPISDEGASPASAIIGAFMELIGQKEIWENIQKGGAVAKAWAWFKGAMAGALALVTSIPGRVMDVIRSLTIFDIVTIAGAFQKIVAAFGSFAGDFFRWAGGTVLALLEIILSVVAPTMVPYLKKAGAAFHLIIKAPGTFIGTLVRAGKLGFNQFKKNIVRHLTDGVLKWLLGALAGANLYIPQSFDPRELLKFGLSVVGVTWTNIRGKLVLATNETVVRALETGFDLVRTLVTEGPAAAWRQLLESLTNLKAMVMDAIIGYVKQEVVKVAIEKAVSMLTPAGAFIQAILAIYRTITFVVNRLREIGALVAAFIDGIAALARGTVAPAANRIETVLATGLSLAIGFLANFAGLGNVARKVIEIVNKIRTPVDQALDKVVTWVVAQARRLGRFVAQAGVPHDPAERLRLASRAAVTAARALSGRVTAPILEAALAAVRLRYGLTSISVFRRGATWWARASINPVVEQDLGVPTDAPAAAAPAAAGDARQAAGQRLIQILGERASLDTVRATLPRVLGELRPSGLRGLRLQVSPEGTGHVWASASPDKAVVEIANEVEPDLRVIVSVRADIEVAQPAAHAGGPLSPISTVEDDPLWGGTRVRPVAPGQPVIVPGHGSVIPFPAEQPASIRIPGQRGGAQQSRAGQPRIGGAVIVPPSGSGTLSVVAWNTSNNIFSGNNASHAEHQLHGWFITRPREWLRRVRVMRVHISMSPCSAHTGASCGNCTSLIVELASSSLVPNVAPGGLELNWSELYPGGRNGNAQTRIADIIALRRAGWVLPQLATMPLPEGARRELKKLKLL